MGEVSRLGAREVMCEGRDEDLCVVAGCPLLGDVGACLEFWSCQIELL